MKFSESLWNLVCLINMNVYHLRKAEVEYELKIRGLSTEGNANELRKRLQQSVSNNDEIKTAVVNALDVTVELEECEAKLSDLTKCVTDYEGNFSDNEYSRIVARLWHLYLRIERIPIPAGGDNDQEQSRIELQTKTREIIDSFKAPTPEVNPDDLNRPREENVGTTPEVIEDRTEQGEQRALPIRAATTLEPPAVGVGPQHLYSATGTTRTTEMKPPAWNAAHTNAVMDFTRPKEFPSAHARPKYVPVYKWGIKFDNNGSSVAAFLERVEELRRARGVTHSELFESAVDLFSGSALVWYRSSTSRIHSWDQLAKELREAFQPPDYDFRLQQEIFNRIQGDQEPIDLYLSAMEGLYGRLSIQIPESARLAQIFNNLHPQLQDRLALCDIKSLDDLRLMGRRAEAGRLRNSRPRPSPRSDSALEPDLAYQEPHRQRRLTSERVAYVNQRHSGDQSEIMCWNCKSKGHRFKDCRKPRRKFCYGCGKEDTLKRDCTSCSKNVQRRESAP